MCVFAYVRSCVHVHMLLCVCVCEREKQLRLILSHISLQTTVFIRNKKQTFATFIKIQKYWICELYQKSSSMHTADPFLAIRHYKIDNMMYDCDSHRSIFTLQLCKTLNMHSLPTFTLLNTLKV